VLHFGDQNITAAVKGYSDADATGFEAFAALAAEPTCSAPISPRSFACSTATTASVDYSLTSLFTDEQRRIVQAHPQLHALGHRELSHHHLPGPRQPAPLPL
jgi:hypothetical protein